MYKLKIDRAGTITYLRCYSAREARAMQARIMREHDAKQPKHAPPTVKILNLSAR